MKKVFEFMNKTETKLWTIVIGLVLILVCMVMEFVPVPSTVRTIVLSVTAVYYLVMLVYYGLQEYKSLNSKGE